MREMVKNEVLKLLEARVVYLIFNSKWVSHVQVIPKKEGVIGIKND